MSDLFDADRDIGVWWCSGEAHGVEIRSCLEKVALATHF